MGQIEIPHPAANAAAPRDRYFRIVAVPVPCTACKEPGFLHVGDPGNTALRVGKRYVLQVLLGDELRELVLSGRAKIL
jgi:hypothetical protein